MRHCARTWPCSAARAAASRCCLRGQPCGVCDKGPSITGARHPHCTTNDVTRERDDDRHPPATKTPRANSGVEEQRKKKKSLGGTARRTPQLCQDSSELKKKKGKPTTVHVLHKRTSKLRSPLRRANAPRGKLAPMAPRALNQTYVAAAAAAAAATDGCTILPSLGPRRPLSTPPPV